MRYVTAAEMKEIDRAAIEKRGIPALHLMENAGRAVAAEGAKLAGVAPANIAVFCGYGNNGGDGLVAARHLIRNGYKVSVFFVGKPRSLSAETNANLEALFTSGATAQFISGKEEISRALSKAKPAAIVDAVFGIGMHGSLDEFYSSLFGAMNESGAPIVAVDMPSGLDADTGQALGTAVQAAVTVTFGCPKAGFKDPASKKFTGKLVVVNIGFPPDLLPQDRPARTVLQAPAAPVKHKAIKLRGGRFGATRPGHPWIYRRQLLKVDPSIKPGDIVSVISNKGEFLGKGYYNYHSDISIRILTQKNENIDQAFFNDRIKTAAEKRNTLVEHTNAWRAVFSESDGLPGIIVDIYGSTAVLQILTLGMDKRKEFILNAVKDTLKPSYIYEKSASAFRRIESMKDFQAWHGPSGAQFVEIFEGDTKYIVDIVNGHKTGFYLDQRKSRLAISEISRGKSVLDLFCYTGGFAVAAAAGGASQVTAVDIKQQWLELARKNAALNGVAQSVIPVRADAFLFLEEMVRLGKRFDIVIVDPPSFMRNKESLVSARKGYEELNTNAMKVLSDGGTLATFSCSHHMPNEEFAAALKSAAAAAGRTYSILKRCHQDIDHPIARAIPETEYLKGYFLRLGARPKRDTSLL